ncbi:hypothetical protein [Vibrio gallaecicus]|uniref:hypothetical protein n=1 Tax=Vibrio gallaecicus TaxID=552386 RepID=UPI0025B2898C|nr:hypothetical protein [Vibrio gallaecicus]MDN3616521.1 hypothetical protein [Vibrio gallaecicus]
MLQVISIEAPYMDWIGLDWIGLDWIGLEEYRNLPIILFNQRKSSLKISELLNRRVTFILVRDKSNYRNLR